MMTPEEAYFFTIGSSIKKSTASQMFGKPCFKINYKAYICIFNNEMVFKLYGEAHTNALNLEGAKLFDPSGRKRPMKQWVQVPFEYRDEWMEYAKKAANYVRRLSRS